MIGAIVYKLRAENSTQLPFVNGRLMHAAFFKILHEVLPELENFIHDKMNIKPFTVSFLNPAKNISNFEGRWEVRRGDRFFWRVTALNEEILRAAMAVPIGYQIRAGNLVLSVEKIIADEKIRDDSGVISVEDFILSAKNFSPPDEIEFKFLTPVSFRIDDFDAPYPRAELIFASLADKWTQTGMPVAADKKIIREIAEQIRLTEWEGRSRKFYFAHDRGTLGFWGKFRYNLTGLDFDLRKVFLLLARFGEFSGVGRLTAQGFGQTRINFA